MEQITGVVSRITYRNEENGFTVLRLLEESSQKSHICVGIIPSVESGESIAAKGEWVVDKRYGPQFSVSAFELVRPTSKGGIHLLLSSGLVPGIGQTRATLIVDTFGDKTLDILDNEPERLREVPGIGKKRLAGIVKAWGRESHLRTLMLFLQEFGISLNMVHKINKAYGEKAKEVISSNPYKLIDDIWGVGFKKADAIAKQMGFSEDSYRRIKAGIIFVLQEASGEGHVYVPKNEVVDRAAQLLEIPQEAVIFSLDHIVQERVIINEEERLYLPLYFHAEKAVAKKLREKITNQQRLVSPEQAKTIEPWLKSYSQKTGWQGDEKQIQAVHRAIKNTMILITGGPGTGKTTTLQVIVSFFRDCRLRIALAAPTGRAAQRMGSISGLEAKTIHRLLEYNPQKSGNPFTRNSQNPLEVDVLICDEVSMIDTLLMRDLLSAIPKHATLIFVGDSNQLPSVGAGNVLADMIACGIIPHVVFTKIFRQAAKSRIVTAAHEIIDGMVPIFTNKEQDNCFFLSKEEPQQCLETIVDLVVKRVPNRYQIDPVKDIQVLSPMHRGILGTQSINAVLQQRLNPNRKGVTRGDTTFAVGDKVMQIHNNYDNNVFNGDIGFVIDAVEDAGLLVSFNGKSVSYQLKDLDELVHAYCISIHKSQGCEFNTVILPIMTQHFIMLQRNLIYTALTRAKALCILVGMTKAFAIGVNNNQALQRYSRLSQHLAE